MKVSETIKTARKAAGLTQAQLAEKVGIATYTLQLYEKGTREPRAGLMIEIFSALRDALWEKLSDRTAFPVGSEHRYKISHLITLLDTQWEYSPYISTNDLLHDLTEDDLEKLLSYANFLRSQHIGTGDLTEDDEDALVEIESL